MEDLIFIVDDNDANLTMAAMALEEEYRILTMPSAQKMFSLLEKKRPKLIIIDIEMPEMNGFDATVKLRENSQYDDIKVIFLTGMNEDNILSDALKLGALEVIKKPFMPSQLLDCVNKHIAKTKE